MDSLKRILVISLYFKGDFLFHTAALEALKRIVPGAKIDLWIKSRNSDIALNDPRFNEVLIFDDIKTADYNENPKLNFKGKVNFLKKLRGKNYDLIIDMTGKYSTGLFTCLASPKHSAGINYNFFGFCYDNFINLNTSTQEGHLIQKYLSVIKKAFKLDDNTWESITKDIKIKPYIFIDDNSRKFIDEKLKELMRNPEKPFIVLHATSGWSAKELNSEIFADLIKYMNSKEYNFAFIGADSDLKKLEEINSYLDGKEFDLKTRFLPLQFIQSAELIRRADLFIGSDSAPLHTAGAVGTPSIGIFGPTNPEFSKPLGEQHQVLYHRLFCSSADDRQYCTRNGGFTCPTIDCMKMIKSAELMSMIEKALTKKEY